jgi:cysteinyl-tRNA synthetase
MPQRLFDSLQKRKVDLVPVVPGKVGLYLCGPTVQAAPHVGHARSAIAFDVVRRHLTWSGYDVTYVRNVTDIDDKIIAKAAERGVSTEAHAREFADEYQKQMLAVGNLPPTFEPRVTQTIPEIVAFIERLIAAGKAYAQGGDVYYAVESFPAYGALSGQSIDDLRAGARVEVGEHKRNPLDFALWKAAKPGEPKWPSPWGEGRPGWHIECSAMILSVLGERFDVHGGGKDLVFPHHENEIAQSVGALGPGTFAKYWMHNGFVNFNDEKMSKSVGNVFLVSDMCQRFDGESIRFLMVQTHYRSPIAFEVVERPDGQPSFPGLEEAERRLDYFYATLARIDDFVGAAAASDGPVVPEAERLISAVRAAMDDDFNTAVAIAELGDAARAANKLLDDPQSVPKDVRRRSLARLGRDLRQAAVGALGLLGREPREFLHARRTRLAAARGIDAAHVAARLAERDAARRTKDFARADGLREELRALGVEIMDTPRGAEWRIDEGA